MPRIGTVIREVFHRPEPEEVAAHLAGRYGLSIASATRLDAGVTRVEHHGGPPWVARLFVSSRPVGRAHEDAAVLRGLEERGLPAERLAHPEPVSVLDGRAVLVTRLVETGGPLRNTPAARRRLGDLLGRVHALEPAPGAVERPSGSLHHLPQFEGGPDQDLVAARAMLDDLDGRVPPEHRDTYDRLQELLDRGDGAVGLPDAFVHPDPARSNALAGPEGVVFVDWTGAGRGPRLASLAVLVSTVGPHQVDDVLVGYGAHVRLTGEELDRVEGVLWIRPLWLAAWRCWLASISSRVDSTFLPNAGRIAATARAVRAAA